MEEQDNQMGPPATPSLRAGHRRALGLPPDSASETQAPPKTYASVEKLFQDERGELLKIIPPWIVKKAWFALAHLTLEPGATVVDLGCRGGAMAYVMAVLAPGMRFIGIDKNPESITHAREAYKRPNLEFRVADALEGALEDSSADALICNFILHEIYSSSDFNQRLVRQTLRQCQRYLKPGGFMFIRDYAEPHDAENMVLMEMPDASSKSERLEEMSEPDLLVWFSEQATMRDDVSRAGFYLEELPPRFPRTRLFRLPHKWAYEFIMRKDMRSRWQTELPKEYTFYNERDYHKTLNALGLRVLYSAPNWDDVYIKKHFEKNFRLLDEAGNPLGHPATSFAVLAQKIDDRDSLILTERRKAKSQDTPFNITTYRNEADGRLIEVVSRNMNTTEIIPFSLLENGQLVVYLHEGVPRGLVNAVPRGSKNLDGKFWSGHLTEAIAIDTGAVREVEENGAGAVVHFMNDALGLKVSVGQSFVEGPGYYPNPRFIAERVETRFISVEPTIGRFIPRFVRDDIKGFASTGAIRAFDAQSVLNAISVGALPSGNLEMQLLMLFSMLDLKATDWAETPLVLKEEEAPPNVVKISDVLKKTATKDNRYKELRGTLGKIRAEKSVFVDERIDDEGGNRGLAARDIDFVVNDSTGMNVAVILPLSRQHSGEVMAGFVIDFMPVPQRFAGNGTLITLPTIPLPKEIQNMDMAKKFIADQFEIKIDQVAKMGEPYFSYVGLTPQRIFPFAINCPHSKIAMAKHGVTSYAPIEKLARLHWKDLFERYDIDMLKVCGRANKRMFSQNEMCFNWGWDMPMVPKYGDAPFTTGQMVDTRVAPLTQGPANSSNVPAANQTGRVNALPSGAGVKPGDAVGLYAATGGFTAAASKRGEGTSGKGGKTGGSGGGAGRRSVRPKTDPAAKKREGLFTPPEPNK